MKTTVKERLIAFIEHKGLSKNAFEVACGLSSRYVSNISVSISPNMIKKISLTFPDLNTTWLLTGDGSMLTSPTPTVSQHNVNGNNYNGVGTVYNGTQPTDEEYVEAEEITGAPVLPATMYKASNTDMLEFVQTTKNVGRSGISVDGIDVDMFVYVRDEALSPRYEKGDLVALQAYEGEACVIPGRLYAVNTRSNGMQLRLLLTNDDRLREGDYLARSFNPIDFPDYIIKREDIITIFKKVFVIKL